MMMIKTYQVWWKNWKGIKNVHNRETGTGECDGDEFVRADKAASHGVKKKIARKCQIKAESHFVSV